MLFAGALCAGSCFTVFPGTADAEEADASGSSGEAGSEEAAETEEASDSSAEWPSDIEIESECAIVIEASTGTVLYEKNSTEECYPASITKIMTTMLALENCSLDETVTFSEDAVYTTEGSGIYRNVGEEMSMEDCLYAVMLESANECAYAVAEHVADGDYEAFIDMMNEKAEELGCTGTNFTNSHGLPDEDHVTTCYDMALIAQAAIQDDMFRTLISTTTYDLPETNMSEPLTLYNHHKMISNNRTSQYLYEYAIGGKTGYTSAAGNTLVTYAEKDGMMLICVLMKSGSAIQYTDTISLFDYCFENYKLYNVSENETRFEGGLSETEVIGEEVEDFAEIDPDAYIVLPASASFEDTETEANYDSVSDTVAGTLVYSYGGRTVGSADIILTGADVDTYEFTEDQEETDSSADSAEAAEGSSTEESSETRSGPDRQTVIRMIVICAVIAVILLLILWIFRRRSRQRNSSGRKLVKIRDANRKRSSD